MFTSNIPKSFWGDAVITECYLINKMPTRIHNFTPPLIALSNVSIFSIPLKVFGCTAFSHVHDHEHPKLDPRARKCVFLRYSSFQKGYKCYSPVTRKYYSSMDVTFFESLLYFPQNFPQGEKHNIDGNFWESALHIPEDPISPIKESEYHISNETPPLIIPHFSMIHQVLV